MAHFEVPVVIVDGVDDHPNADRLSLVRVKGYTVIAQKNDDGSHRYGPGDVVIYIPEGAIVPEYHLKTQGFWDDEKGKGVLSGADGDRVKAIKLRGTMSQGLIFRCDEEHFEFEYGVKSRVHVGDDYSSRLGIVKYIPRIPESMSGEVIPLHGYTINYDIENIQKYPDVLMPNEDITITEKIHGTFCGFGFVPELHQPGELAFSSMFAFSKGLGAKGLVFKYDSDSIETNIYCKMFNTIFGGEDGMGNTRKDFIDTYLNVVRSDKPSPAMYILGEIYGPGVQDLQYGLEEKKFRAFDVYLGLPTHGHYLSAAGKRGMCDMLSIDMVPSLYTGPYNPDVVEEYTQGMESVSGKQTSVREGVVITPTLERRDDQIGRVILKSVNDKYLTRRGGTERS